MTKEEILDFVDRCKRTDEVTRYQAAFELIVLLQQEWNRGFDAAQTAVEKVFQQHKEEPCQPKS